MPLAEIATILALLCGPSTDISLYCTLQLLLTPIFGYSFNAPGLMQLIGSTMGTIGYIGILVTAAEGGSRLLPLEFTFRDGAWWAMVPLELSDEVNRYDGQRADVILLEGDTARISGILACGAMRTDRHFLVSLLPEEEAPERPVRRDLPRAA